MSKLTLTLATIAILWRDFGNRTILCRMAAKVVLLMHPIAFSFAVAVAGSMRRYCWSKQNCCKVLSKFSSSLKTFNTLLTFYVIDRPRFLRMRRRVVQVERELWIILHAERVLSIAVIERSRLRLKMIIKRKFDQNLSQQRLCFTDYAILISQNHGSQM